MEFEYEVKIPKDRVAVLIGKRGEIKRTIEKKLGVKMRIDSEEGDVVLEGEDSLKLLVGQNIVKAIGRGFNPDVALLLLDENYVFELVDMEEFAGKSRNKLVRIRARVIGTGGKARTMLEGMTGTHVVVYGKTIGIIGDYESVDLARRAVEKLLGGSRHGSVYKWIEEEKKKRL